MFIIFCLPSLLYSNHLFCFVFYFVLKQATFCNFFVILYLLKLSWNIIIIMFHLCYCYFRFVELQLFFHQYNNWQIFFLDSVINVFIFLVFFVCYIWHDNTWIITNKKITFWIFCVSACFFSWYFTNIFYWMKQRGHHFFVLFCFFFRLFRFGICNECIVCIL